MVDFKQIYNILPILKNTYNEIKYLPNTTIHLCIFNIIYNIPNRNINSPFLNYLLYKFPGKKNNVTSNFLTFPFQHWNSNTQKPINIANELYNKLTSENDKSLGFIQEKNDIYFFYNYTNNIYDISFKDKNSQLWWCIIDEICNHKKVINFPVHYKTFIIFYKNPDLIFLKKDNKNLEIPIVSYFGNTVETLSFIATFGIKSNPIRNFGPYYYYGSFIKMIGHGSWHSNYTKRTIFDKIINDKNGKYKKGGVVRFALFLGNFLVVLNRKLSPFKYLFDYHDSNNAISDIKKNKFDKLVNKYKGNWTKSRDSLILGNIKYKNRTGYYNLNPEYVTKEHNQQIPLSVHLIDMNSVKTNWDPTYDKYKIK